MNPYVHRKISLRTSLPSGESYYSDEAGATIKRHDGGFVIVKDGVRAWTPDANVVGTFE